MVDALEPRPLAVLDHQAAAAIRVVELLGAAARVPLRLELRQQAMDLAEVHAVAARVGAPVLGVVLLVNLGLAIMGRSVSQLNVFVTSFPLTIAAGLFVMGAALPYGGDLLELEYGRLYDTVSDLMRLLGHG